jgi:predicted lipoprotein with Yx(FWY)xxD motif
VTIRRSLILVLPLAFALAACSGGGATADPSVAPATQAPASEAPASEAPASEAPASEAPDAAASITLADNALGTILADGAGKTLYAFTKDVDGESTCYDDCAGAWPPLLADGAPVAGDGLDAAMLTTVERTDGTTQLKYGDWPLYYWAADSAPGDATGQGVGGVWFVIAADGSLIGAPAGDSSPDGY